MRKVYIGAASMAMAVAASMSQAMVSARALSKWRDSVNDPKYWNRTPRSPKARFKKGSKR